MPGPEARERSNGRFDIARRDVRRDTMHETVGNRLRDCRGGQRQEKSSEQQLSSSPHAALFVYGRSRYNITDVIKIKRTCGRSRSAALGALASAARRGRSVLAQTLDVP